MSIHFVAILKRSKGPLRINGDLVSLVLLTSTKENPEIICCIYLLRGMHFKLFLLKYLTNIPIKFGADISGNVCAFSPNKMGLN